MEKSNNKSLEEELAGKSNLPPTLTGMTYDSWDYKLLSKGVDYLGKFSRKISYGVTAIGLCGMLYGLGQGTISIAERRQLMEDLGIKQVHIGLYEFTDISDTEAKEAWTKLEEYDRNNALKVAIMIPSIIATTVGFAAANTKDKQKEQ